jgi:uncharacterized membrane-anchored protein
VVWVGFQSVISIVALSVISIVALVILLRDAVIVWRSPEYKREAECLREQRRIRKAAKR